MAFSSPSGIGSVSDLHFLGLDPQAKFIAIDEQSKDNVMQLDRPGNADRLPPQACDPGAAVPLEGWPLAPRDPGTRTGREEGIRGMTACEVFALLHHPRSYAHKPW